MSDEKYMQLALDLAKKGEYGVQQNPMVGCVIVKNDKIIATGFHQKIGQNHAEINALEKINFNANSCDIYITLEPCSHFGKTPPCVDAIIKAKPQKVIIASTDSNPQVASINKMQQTGIEVIVGVLEQKEIILNRGFHKRMHAGIPFLTCKIASSLDGKTAMHNGESKWITNKEVKNDVFKMRAKNGAIISGSGTILKDNPSFNVRICDACGSKLPSPIKIIMDKSGKIIDKTLNIFQGEELVITDKPPVEVLKMLGKMQINYAMIEAGSQINQAFLPYIDELIVYQAPIIMGSDAKDMFAGKIKTMAKKINFSIAKIKQIKDNIKITYTPQNLPFEYDSK